jgi:hypothetical protein
VTDGFVSSELERSIERILRYLRGETDRLNLSTDLREIKRSVRTEIIDGVRIDAPQLVGANTDRIGAERVAQLASNEQSYRDAQLNLSTQERAEIDAEMQTNVRRQLSNESEPLARTILDHQRTVLDGLTGELSYQEYVDQLGADQRQIKAEIAALALREVPNQQSLFGEESDPKSALAPIRAGTGLVTIFTWLLPLLAVGLVGVGYVLTRSVDQTATVAGASLLVAGILGAILGFVAGPAVKSAVGVGGGSSDPIIAGLTGVVDGALGTIASQSLLLAVVGSLVLVTVGADRRGLLDGVRGRLSLDARTERR